MKYGTIGLILLLYTTACAKVPSEPQTLICPDVVEYSCEVQHAAADELEKNVTPVISEFMKDYKVMRAQSRICSGRLPPKPSC